MHHHVTVDESVELATMTLNPASSLQSDFDQVTAYKGGKTWSTKKKVTVALLAALGIGVLVVVILGALNELKVIHLTDTLTGSNSDANGATPESIQGANHTDATSSSTGGGGGVLPPGPFPPVPGGATGSGGASGSGGGGATGATGPAGPPHVLPIPADRVAEVSQYNGRSFEPPQYFTDNIAAEFHSPTTTPPLLGAITHHSARDGPWSSASSWTEGTVPNANAIVQIDHAIVYDVESSVQIRQIKVSGQGKLSWDRSKDTLLWLDTGIAYGVVDMGDYWSPIPESATPGKPRAEVVFWQSAAPLATTNLGFLFFGPTRMNGAVKADRLFLQDQALVGATSISFVPGTVATSNWRVGDTIVVGSTSDYERYNTDPEYTGPTKFWGPRQNGYMMTDLTVTGDEEQSYGYAKSFDEKRVITAISGDTVSFAGGLSYQHDVISETLHSNDPVVMLPVVINLSRSIRFRSAVPSVRQKRAHLMFGFGDNFQIRWIEAKDMGRTELDPTMWLSDGEIGYADAAKTQQISDPTNVKGRYPIHFHALAKGPTFAARQSVLEGASVWGDQVVVPGRGIAHHVGRLAIEHCVVYNVRGSGMFSETGSEIGQWVDNTVMSIRGDGFGQSNHCYLTTISWCDCKRSAAAGVLCVEGRCCELGLALVHHLVWKLI
jgi:hypothetical protein